MCLCFFKYQFDCHPVQGATITTHPVGVSYGALFLSQ